MKYMALLATSLVALSPVPAVNTPEPGVTIIDLLAAPGIDEAATETTQDTDGYEDVTPDVDPLPHTLEPAPHEPTIEEVEPTVEPTIEEVEPTVEPTTEPLPAEEPVEAVIAPASFSTAMSEDDFDLLTAPLETDQFHVAGITWATGNVERVDIRTLNGGSWSEWYTLELDSEGTPGTEPFIAGGSTGLQVRAQWVEQPSNFHLSLMDGQGDLIAEERVDGEVAEDLPDEGSDIDQAVNAEDFVEPAFFVPQNAELEVIPASFVTPATSANTDVPAPTVTSRAEWGVEQLAPTWKVTQSDLKGAIIHHTAGTNNYTQAQSPGIVRSIWRFHTIDRGWGDIGYNFLIDKYGRIYEGRSGSLTAPAGQMSIGAHAAPANTSSVGISVIGNYTGNVYPSQLVMNAMRDVLAWQFARAGVDATGTRTYLDQAGVTRTISTIAGHKDVAATVCPANIYPLMNSLRLDVKREADRLSQSEEPVVNADIAVNYSTRIGHGWPAHDVFGAGDFDSDGNADLFLRTASGDLLFYQGTSGDGVRNGKKIGHGWRNIGQLFTGTDFDGDGNVDIVAVARTGELYLYPGNGNAGFQRMRQIGRGWHNFNHIFVTQSGRGGVPTIYAVTKDSKILSYSTDGKGTIISSRAVDGTASHFNRAVPVGDWNEDGYTDLISVDTKGILYFHRANGDGTFAQRARFGRGWNNFTHILPRDSIGKNGRFFGTTKDGILYTYSFRYTG